MWKFILGTMVLLVAYLLLWPVPIEPQAWDAPEDKGLVDEFARNTSLQPLELIPIEGDSGPEDLALDSQGNLVMALHSGAIMRLAKDSRVIEPWVNTGGRPLGIEFDQQGNLIVADAYLGLLSVDTDGQITVLTNSADGISINFADDLDIAENGVIYFSDASVKFGAKDNSGTLPASLLDIMEHGGEGRILAYDPVSAETKVLVTNLNFPNGVAMSHDHGSFLFNETGSYRVLRYWLKGEKKDQTEVLIDNLPGFPDNLAQAPDGNYWLGLASPRSKDLDDMSDKPFLRKLVQRLPEFLRPQEQAYAHVVKINDAGEVVSSLQDPSGDYGFTTGVVETEKFLYVSSLTEPALARKAR